MTNYAHGKIYKIESKLANLTYYGSTAHTLHNRMIRHRAAYQRYMTGASVSFTSSFMVLAQDDAKISLVEAYPCDNSRELCEHEGTYIINNTCVNLNVAGRTTQQYYIDNRAKFLETSRRYYENNKEYHKAYVRTANSQPTQCTVCDKTIRKGSVRAHKRTWKHIISLLRSI